MVKLARPRNALKKKPCILRPPGLMICWKFEYSRYFWKTTDSDLIGRKSFHRTSFWHSDNPKCKGKEPVNYLFGNAFLELYCHYWFWTFSRFSQSLKKRKRWKLCERKKLSFQGENVWKKVFDGPRWGYDYPQCPRSQKGSQKYYVTVKKRGKWK